MREEQLELEQRPRETKELVRITHLVQSVVFNAALGMLLFDAATVELTCGDIPGSPLHQSVDLAYRETSKRLLEILHTKYKFMDHLKVCCCLLVCLPLSDCD